MTIIILCIAAYLIGAIPAGLWIGKIFFKRSARVWFWKYWYNEYFPYSWKKAGIIVFIFDLLKGTLATLLPLIFHVHGVSPLIFGLLAVVGHTVSVFDKFKGGKAVATSAGVVLGFNPVFLLYLAVVFFLVLYLFSMISLSSILGAVAALIGVLVFLISTLFSPL